MARRLPLASDRDRLAAARYAAYRLFKYLSRREAQGRRIWLSAWRPDGSVRSKREPYP